VVGLESSRDTFRRYKAIRQREREYVSEQFGIQSSE
jgi:hypothetical protein